MQLAAKRPEAVATRELALTFGLPALRVTPKPNRIGTVGQVDDTAGIQRNRLRWFEIQMLENACMAAAWLQPCHLGGTDVKGVRATAEGSCTATQLMVGFQQRDL